MRDVLIVGGGIFGRVIGRALAHQGLDVVIYDSSEPGRASPAAACLMKPGWFSGFTKQEVDDSLNLLDQLYGVEKLTFGTRAGGLYTSKTVPVFWVDPQKILGQNKLHNEQISHGKVISICERLDKCFDVRVATLPDEEVYEVAKTVIIAAGIWCHPFSRAKVEPKAGIVFRSPGQLKERIIDIWAPYKQLVAFNISPGEIWVGDGTSLKPESLTNERKLQSLERCKKYIRDGMQSIVGYRPYVKDAKPAYLVEESPGWWVATGGAKNGTIAAAWCALKLREQLT